MMIKSYVLFLYLCCQPVSERQEIAVASPQAASVVVWEKNQGGRCYSGKLIEYTRHLSGEDEVREIAIPKVVFTP